jgi:hypothetical protein
VTLVENRPPDRPAAHVHEDQPVPAGLRAGRELLLELFDKECGNADRSDPRPGLGLLADPTAGPAGGRDGADVHQLLSDREAPAQ